MCDLAHVCLRSLDDGELKDKGGEFEMTAVLVDHIPVFEGSVGTPEAAARYPNMADVAITPPPRLEVDLISAWIWGAPSGQPMRSEGANARATPWQS